MTGTPRPPERLPGRIPERLPVPANRFDRAAMWLPRLLGITGPDGYLSFSKTTVALVVLSYFVHTIALQWRGAVLVVTPVPIPVGIAFVVIAGAYGMKAFLTLVGSGAVKSQETVTVDSAKVLDALHDGRAALLGGLRHEEGA